MVGFIEVFASPIFRILWLLALSTTRSPLLIATFFPSHLVKPTIPSSVNLDPAGITASSSVVPASVIKSPFCILPSFGTFVVFPSLTTVKGTGVSKSSSAGNCCLFASP